MTLTNLLVSPQRGPVDLDRIDIFLDLEVPYHTAAYSFMTVTRKGRLSFMLTNANEHRAPAAYHHGDKILILSRFEAYVIDAHHPREGYDIHPMYLPVYAARWVEDGVVILHAEGCTLMSHDLSKVLWRIEDRRITTSRVDGGVLKVYHGEHQFITIDTRNGREKETRPVLPAAAPDANDANVIVMSRFRRR
jgi:hypothetical protein